MTTNPSLNIQVHMNDETEMEVSRVPSEKQDFVSIKLGWPVSILLFNAVQAKNFADTAIEAYRLLMKIETDIKASELAEYKDEVIYPDFGDEDGYDCTIDHPCRLCLETMN